MSRRFLRSTMGTRYVLYVTSQLVDTRGAAALKGGMKGPPERSCLYQSAILVKLLGEELHTGDDDTCDGHGSHRGSPRHENGGRHYKSYGAAVPAAV